MRRAWWGAAAVLAVSLVSVVDVADAARRNVAYVALLRHRDAPDVRPVTGSTSADRRLDLRRAMLRGDWASVASALGAAPPDRLESLLVIRAADDRRSAGDLTGARAALAALRAQPGYDAEVWYRAGAAYERMRALGDAAWAYEHGGARDPGQPWAEGRYRAAVLHQQQGECTAVVSLLSVPFASAGDADFARPVQLLEPGGAIWQGAFLVLGEAYEQLGRVRDAETVYDRVSRLPAPRRDWTFNRVLVALARVRAARGQVEGAAWPLADALDLTETLDPPVRARFERDTAAAIDELARALQRPERVAERVAIERAAAAQVGAHPASAGAWFVLGALADGRCDRAAARDAFTRALRLVPAGAGAHVAARLDAARKDPCPRQ